MSLRFRPRLIPTVAAVAMIALTLHLSRWQSGREQEKLAQQALLEARMRMPPHALQAKDGDAEALKYRKVTAVGEYVASKQIYLDNKDLNGAVGFHVLTPLKLAGSDVSVMVNRGWIARGRDYPNPPVAIPPAGTVEASGLAVLPGQRFLELSPINVQGSVWQNFTFDRARTVLGLDVLPVVVLAAQTAPGLMLVVEVPNAGAEKHRGYAFQWMALAAAVFAVWVIVNFRMEKNQS